MESMGVISDFWSGRRVLITGHSGFKGSWLSLWLNDLGAHVIGYSLDPPSTPSLFQEAEVGAVAHSIRADVRDLRQLKEAIDRHEPTILYHMAAQSLVSRSYEDPVETYSTNVMGTVNVLEAARTSATLRAVVVVTSDKCYREGPSTEPHRESDPLGGGNDPYSTSKASAEFVTRAYSRSLFPATGPRIVTVRAGNVIGGGDWARDRLVPDLMRAFRRGSPVRLRHPEYVRPWQHVIEPLHGYMKLAETLVLSGSEMPDSWNFGPNEEDSISVRELAESLIAVSGTGSIEIDEKADFEERMALRLDSRMAREKLGWRPHLSLSDALVRVAGWHQAHARGESARELVRDDIRWFESRCDCS